MTLTHRIIVFPFWFQQAKGDWNHHVVTRPHPSPLLLQRHSRPCAVATAASTPSWFRRWTVTPRRQPSLGPWCHRPPPLVELSRRFRQGVQWWWRRLEQYGERDQVRSSVWERLDQSSLLSLPSFLISTSISIYISKFFSRIIHCLKKLYFYPILLKFW